MTKWQNYMLLNDQFASIPYGERCVITNGRSCLLVFIIKTGNDVKIEEWIIMVESDKAAIPEKRKFENRRGN